MGFTNGKQIISSVRNQLGLDENTFVIIKACEKELGRYGKNAELTGVVKGKLVIEVASSAHFQELSLRRKQIINKLNQHVQGRRIVKGIIIKLKE